MQSRHCEPFDKLRVVSQSNQSEFFSDEAIYVRDQGLSVELRLLGFD